MTAFLATDRTVLDLLRRQHRMTVADFEQALGVTATAVRQRLNRLLASGLIGREKVVVEGRGRPSHCYVLTTLGKRKTGANFADLATVLWDEVRSIEDKRIRKGLLERISGRLAELYRGQVARGKTVTDRMQAAVDVFSEHQVPLEVDDSQEMPALRVLACPYPDLAEKDRSICAMERMMLSDLVGAKLSLDECRLDGGACCTFNVRPAVQDTR